ncbi:MAG: ABC transporter substrate-binding protein [Rhodoplanes sp.]|uniref:ABC transporter substrate-binding protein n=1 Tax=Rhodoplanes sp. TaxID=1968906 RepID=UPI001802E8C3|nr:ABC transporter substrate-binding protein [Rhodoplanes sp.]NVO13429.1 ABC transporter substrate-binding protein [Rhodoplanes sp.]
MARPLFRLPPALMLAAFALVATAAVLAPAPARALDQVVLRINFTPWGMHAQYFGGRAQGFYRDEGIELEIRPPSAGQQNEVFIATGREQFGLTNADAFVKARGSGLPIVAVMADQPDNPFAVITLQKSGIAKPADLKGKKLAWFQANVKGMVEPLLASGGLKLGDIEFVMVARGAEVQMLAAGQVDGLFGYSFGQALTLEQRGFPVNVMPVRDYGVQFYGTVLYTSDALLKSNPDLVRRFVRATLKSLIWTRDHIETAMKEIVAVSPDRDLKLESRKLEMIYDLYRVPDYETRFGLMTDAKWASSIKILADSGDLPKPPKPQDMYTNRFVDELAEAEALAALLRNRKPN